MTPIRFLALALCAAFAVALAASCVRRVDLVSRDAAIFDAPYHPDISVDASIDAAFVAPDAALDAAPDSTIDAM